MLKATSHHALVNPVAVHVGNLTRGPATHAHIFDGLPDWKAILAAAQGRDPLDVFVHLCFDDELNTELLIVGRYPGPVLRLT